MRDQNEQLVRRVSEAFASGDMATFFDLHTDDVVFHVPGRSRFAGEHRGKQAYMQVLQEQLGTLDGPPEQETHDLLASDDHVVALLTIRGTRGGNPLELRQVIVAHVRDGKISEVWGLPEDQYAADEMVS